MSIKTNKLGPVCKISKYPLKESTGMFILMSFLATMYACMVLYVDGKKIIHAELPECSK